MLNIRIVGSTHAYRRSSLRHQSEDALEPQEELLHAMKCRLGGHTAVDLEGAVLRQCDAYLHTMCLHSLPLDVRRRWANRGTQVQARYLTKAPAANGLVTLRPSDVEFAPHVAMRYGISYSRKETSEGLRVTSSCQSFASSICAAHAVCMMSHGRGRCVLMVEVDDSVVHTKVLPAFDHPKEGDMLTHVQVHQAGP